MSTTNKLVLVTNAGSRQKNQTDYTITVFALDSDEKAVEGKVVTYSVDGQQEIVIGITPASGQLSHQLTVPAGESWTIQAFDKMNSTSSNTLDLLGPQPENPILEQLRKLARFVFRRRILAAMALLAFLYVAYEFAIERNSAGQLIPERDAKAISTASVKEGLRSHHLSQTSGLQRQAENDPDAAINNLNRELQFQQIRESKIGQTDNLGCQYTVMSDSARNLTMSIPYQCTGGGERSVIRMPKDSGSVLKYQVSAWKIPQIQPSGLPVLDSRGQQLVVTAGPAEFSMAEGTHSCSEPDNNKERVCEFSGIAFLKIPYPGGKIEMTFLEEKTKQ